MVIVKEKHDSPPLVGLVSRPSEKNCTKHFGTPSSFAASTRLNSWVMWEWTPPSLTYNTCTGGRGSRVRVQNKFKDFLRTFHGHIIDNFYGPYNELLIKRFEDTN